MPLLYEELTYQIRGAVFKVYNELGFGHKESVYQKALASELTRNKIKFEQEKSLSILFNNEKVGHYKPDFVVEDKIIIEIKATELNTKEHEKQLQYYLKGTNFRLGLLINFGRRPLLIRRIIWSTDYRPRESGIRGNPL